MIIPGAPKFPYFTAQQLNLDWLLEKVSLLERKAIGQVDIETLYDDADYAVIAALNRYKDKIPFGASIIHLGRYTDQTQVFILFCRADDQRGHGIILYSTSNNISISEIELTDGVWVASTAPEYGTTVVANPVLSGTEADLTGLQVGDTKYKVPAGGGGGVLVVNATIEGTTITLDKTWQEITDASFPVVVAPDGTGGVAWNTIRSTYLDNGNYTVEMVVGNVGEGRSLSYAVMYLTANSANGYPAMSMGA